MIEITRKGTYIFRQNPVNPRIIDRRLNRRGARWERYKGCITEEEARNTLLQIERQAREESK